MWLLALMLVTDTIRTFPLALTESESLSVTVAGAGALRTFTVDSIPGVGHFIQEERPQAVVAAVAAVLRAQGGVP